MKWLAVLALFTALSAGTAHAEWRFYGAGELGYSVLDASADGQVRIATTDFDLSGSDDDVSPLVSGAFGIAVPIDELLPRRFTGRTRLPRWPMRFEIEGVGLREYDLRTSSIIATSGPIHSKVESWAVMSNLWFDLPMGALYRPISWTSSRVFGRWRLKTVKSLLERMSFDVGVGIGLASLDVTVREADARGSDTAYNFAWQAGAGFGYRLTDRVKLTAGYRYFDPGDSEIGLQGSGIPNRSNSKLKLDNDIHEARVGVRVLLHEFAGPWR